jgi:hypothetical protein
MIAAHKIARDPRVTQEKSRPRHHGGANLPTGFTNLQGSDVGSRTERSMPMLSSTATTLADDEAP